jgi:hypothetical protein
VPKCLALCKWNQLNRKREQRYNPDTECCTDGGVQPKYPIKNFVLCEQTRVKRKGFKPDESKYYCGPADRPPFPDVFGKANFLPHCKKHDRCYDTCRSDRKECDRDFCEGLFKACANAYPKVRGKKGPKRRSCEGHARDYCDATIALGGFAYDDAQSKACQCCP